MSKRFYARATQAPSWLGRFRDMGGVPKRRSQVVDFETAE